MEESIWGSRRVADPARFIMEIEEEGVETDYIPESATTRLIKVDVDVKKRQVHVQCIHGIGTTAVVESTLRDWSIFY